jgi:hypothetical protein
VLSDETLELLRSGFQRQLDDLRTLLDERHVAQGRAIDAAMAAADKAVQAALDAAEKAVDKAERASEKRFESVNEFRGQLVDQAKTFMPRAEYTVQHQALEDKVAALGQTLSERIEANTKQINDALLGLGVYRADELARRGMRDETRAQANWTVGQLVTVAAALLAAGLAVVALLR